MSGYDRAIVSGHVARPSANIACGMCNRAGTILGGSVPCRRCNGSGVAPDDAPTIITSAQAVAGPCACPATTTTSTEAAPIGPIPSRATPHAPAVVAGAPASLPAEFGTPRPRDEQARGIFHVRLTRRIANEAIETLGPVLAVATGMHCEAAPGVYEARTNPRGAVSILLPDGKWFGVKPGEYEEVPCTPAPTATSVATASPETLPASTASGAAVAPTSDVATTATCSTTPPTTTSTTEPPARKRKLRSTAKCVRCGHAFAEHRAGDSGTAALCGECNRTGEGPTFHAFEAPPYRARAKKTTASGPTTGPSAAGQELAAEATSTNADAFLDALSDPERQDDVATLTPDGIVVTPAECALLTHVATGVLPEHQTAEDVERVMTDIAKGGNWLGDVAGKWPGDETEAELMGAMGADGEVPPMTLADIAAMRQAEAEREAAELVAGFPTTDEEIDAFIAEYVPTAEERAVVERASAHGIGAPDDASPAAILSEAFSAPPKATPEETARALAMLDSEAVADQYRAEVGDLAQMSDRGAEWVIGKLLDREAQKARIHAQAEAMCAELERDQRAITFRFAPLLEQYARGNLKGKSRHVKTLAGNVGFRSSGGGLKVVDADAARKWALDQEDPDAFGSTTFRLDSRAVVSHVKGTGEAVPGVESRPARETFYVASGETKINVSALLAPKGLPHDDEEE